MSISPILDVIDAVTAERKEGFQTVLKITRLDPASPLIRILLDGKRPLNRQHFRPLLEKVVEIVRKHDVGSSSANVNDWPFENFWGDRIAETRHSKMLGFFIDANAETAGDQCAKPLLKSFLETLAPKQAFNLDGCEVETEKPTEFGRIDLLITRRRNDGDNFGVIIENKINNAPDAEQQLWRYVSSLVSEGLPRDRVYVRYLPLTPDKRPNSSDVAAIKSVGVDFAEVSFKDHILPWLEDVIDDWPSDLDPAMRDNLCHYRNFIRYLVNNKYRKLKMNTEILNKLNDSNIDIASLAFGIEQLKASTEALDACLYSARVGALLIATQKELKRLGAKSSESWFFLDAFDRIEPRSHFDPCFYRGTNLCLAVNDQVKVCLGFSVDEKKNGCWLGYMKQVDGDVTEETRRAILLEASERSKKAVLDDTEPWFQWWYRKVDIFDGCEEILALEFSRFLIGMRDGLRRRLRDGA